MLVLLSGVSGAGKDTIKKELLKRMNNVTTMPSYTDRKPREGEVPGTVYNFVTTEEFEEIKKKLWDKVKEINKSMPKYKYIKEMILTEEELIKTTTLKIKRFEEIKKVL